jgi:hypothetical protein
MSLTARELADKQLFSTMHLVLRGRQHPRVTRASAHSEASTDRLHYEVTINSMSMFIINLSQLSQLADI